RSDDVINMAGHRLSAGSIEAAIAGHEAVAECAVIGLPDELKGQRPIAYVVLKTGVEVDKDRLREELIQRVREQIGAIATLHDAVVVAGLPKTRSGKILRKTIRQITAGEEYEVPSTIEDPAVLVALEDQILAAQPELFTSRPGDRDGNGNGNGEVVPDSNQVAP
ncbi:AMP-binding enzyme, partial [Nocardia cyriacigeorgica]